MGVVYTRLVFSVYTWMIPLFLSLSFLPLCAAAKEEKPSSHCIPWGEFIVIHAKHLLLQEKRCFELVHFLIAKHNYQKYLEIGAENGSNFQSVIVKEKYCLSQTTWQAFFQSNQQTFDLILINGSCPYAQVVEEVENSLKFLNPKGTIVFCGCLQQQFDLQRYIQRHYQDVYMCILDIGGGCGIITPSTTQHAYGIEIMTVERWLENEPR